MQDIVYGVASLAKRLDRGQRTIYNYIKKGLPYEQTEAGKIFDMEKVHEWMRTRKRGK